MGDPQFVAGDWGTTHCRLFLCQADGSVLDTITGPGAADSRGRFEAIFDGLRAPWQQRYGAMPTILCGMVGSSIGWVQAPYVACPALPKQIAAACVSPPERSISIVPGLSCRNRFGAPDFLRGEETQIMGALSNNAALCRGHHLLCLPGTHTKWVLLQEGAISEFLTAPTGELFALLQDHSVLVRDGPQVATTPGGESFEQGVAEFNRFPQAQLLHRLFECRSRRLSGELATQDAAAFLSGLLIASDIAGALQALPHAAAGRTVQLIGSPALTSLYARALERHGYASTQFDGAIASITGLGQIHRQLHDKKVVMNAAH
jgi:2-dehydro-3-deoxygalactonokinase